MRKPFLWTRIKTDMFHWLPLHLLSLFLGHQASRSMTTRWSRYWLVNIIANPGVWVRSQHSCWIFRCPSCSKNYPFKNNLKCFKPASDTIKTIEMTLFANTNTNNFINLSFDLVECEDYVNTPYSMGK